MVVCGLVRVPVYEDWTDVCSRGCTELMKCVLRSGVISDVDLIDDGYARMTPGAGRRVRR
jgi:hypothetical protein